jgi:MFS family permease
MMREDLGWSYLLAGGMNTANALGYFWGALVTPFLMRRFSVRTALLYGALFTALFLFLSGFFTDSTTLLVLRMFAGVASAFTFIAGGVLAAQLGQQHERRVGLLLGLYCGGAGLGIAISAQLVPQVLERAHHYSAAHAWQWAWIALAVICLLATIVMRMASQQIVPSSHHQASHNKFRPGFFIYGLMAYGLFGVGYIGYMTFVVALLKQQGMASSQISGFYTLLGLGAVVSPFIWARMLDQFKGGQSLAILNFLLAVATVLPALSTNPSVAFISGILFGAVFLSAVASTSALVRHNLPPALWPAGISAFTIVFAFGQIVGPIAAGWISDGPGGLLRGFFFSAIALLLGSLLATRQQASALRN